MSDRTDLVGCGCLTYILFAWGIVDWALWLVGAYPAAVGFTLVGLVVVALIASGRTSPRRDPPPATSSPPPQPVRWSPPPPPGPRPVPVILTLPGPRCLVCRAELRDDVINCWRCRTPHHRACFRYAGACAVYACRCRRYRTAPRIPTPAA